jgi:cytochrome bd ubiquinol oxidase subunit II
VVDNNDDPLVTVVDDDADLRKAIVHLLSFGIEARAFNSAPIATPRVADRWSIWPNIAIVAAPPITALLAWLGVLLSRYSSPWAHVLFLVSVAGLGASLWPEAMPGVVSLWQAASMHRTHVIFGSFCCSIRALVIGFP